MTLNKDKVPSVRIYNAAMDESPLRGGSIILRGVVHNDSLRHLQVDTYQREVLPITPKSRLLSGLVNGQPFPEIELGMRGQRYTTRDGVYYMHDPLMIIDGLQRVSAASKYLSQGGNAQNVHIGCTIHFGTDRQWERERFDTLNANRSKVSPNILIRNNSEDHSFVQLLLTMTQDATNFPLHQKVQWGQRMQRTELTTALLVIKTMTALHSHRIPGSGSQVFNLLRHTDRLIESVGINIARANLMTYYKLIDTLWGIRNIQYRDIAPQLKGTFQLVLAEFLSDHTDFWKSEDRQLVIDTDVMKKLSSFKITDPSVIHLCSTSGPSRMMLYEMIKRHVNSGKRTHRLTVRDSIDHERFYGKNEETADEYVNP